MTKTTFIGLRHPTTSIKAKSFFKKVPMNQGSKSDLPTLTCSFSQIGNVPYGILSTDSTSISSWIIDSRAGDHMTWNPHFFSTYIPSARNEKVKIADGSFSTIAGKGTVKLTLFRLLLMSFIFQNCLIIFCPSSN